MREMWVCELGLIAYEEALALQSRLRAERQAEQIPDVLLLLEHPPVYTRGRRTLESELPLGEEFYARAGIEIIDVDRGGKLTYHGPGQLVGYPIMRIGDVVGALRTMEQAIIATLAGEGIAASASPRPTGVWVGPRKIASLGLHVARRVSTHGFAINVDCDLDPFSWIVPCGLPDVAVTSVLRETGRRGRGAVLRPRIAAELAEAFGARSQSVTGEQLGVSIGALAAG